MDHLTSSSDKSSETIINTKVTALNDDVIYSDFDTQIPRFAINRKLIKVPSKIPYALDRFTPKHLLKAIHPNIEVAKEMCLLFVRQLNSTYFDLLHDENNEGWKSLKAEYLRELFSFDSMAYKHIIEALVYPLTKGAILECDYIKIEGKKCYHYRLGANYLSKGIKTYELKTNEATHILNQHYSRILSEVNQNVICKNLIKVYGDITLPTLEQINKEADRLIRLKYKTKKGKRLVRLNKHPKSYFKNADELSFVEDGIEIFQYLTENGLIFPMAGSESSGGRVVDSFTLMPSWIRRLVKWKGKKLIECDFSALHPNIAMSLYEGKAKYLKHGDLANVLEIDINLVKVEHLSFFNKTSHQMKLSPLYDYYMKKEPRMLKNILNEKLSIRYKDKIKHRITSMRLFAKEVGIMTEVISILNSEEIYVLYVYDALLCTPKDTARVLDVMDSTALKHGVYTTAKCTGYRKYNPLTAHVLDNVLDEKIKRHLKIKG